MQIGARDTKAARRKSLVAVVLADRRLGQLDLVVAKLPLEGAGGMEVGDIDDVFFAQVDGQVFGANGLAAGQDDGALDHVFEFADVARPGVGLKQAAPPARNR